MRIHLEYVYACNRVHHESWRGSRGMKGRDGRTKQCAQRVRGVCLAHHVCLYTNKARPTWHRSRRGSRRMERRNGRANQCAQRVRSVCLKCNKAVLDMTRHLTHYFFHPRFVFLNHGTQPLVQFLKSQLYARFCF